MDKIRDYYSFVFRGLLTEQSLDKAGRHNRNTFSEEAGRELSERLGLSLLEDELVNKAKRMAMVYTAICAFENYVRDFVSKKLMEVQGENWWTECVSEKIRSKAESRKKEESNTRWHTPRGDALISYTEFGDLASIMQQNWEQFEPHIDSLDWARHIIESLEKSRNVIMHSGELAPQDIERVGMNIRDWIRQVG
ncbi:MAG: hypothetical protein IT405_01715 [Candidatus Yanofskybacteria bacterium]|nr:hypothetical protein [Candidatus Yanofskybacteria bacterium]